MRAAHRAFPVLLALCLAVPPAWAAHVARTAQPARVMGIDLQRRIDANRLNMYSTNFGGWAWDLSTGMAGLLYPRGTSKTSAFAAGLWLGATVNGQVRTAVAEYSQEYGPGAILPDGSWDSPANPAYKVYKVAAWTGNTQDTAHVEQYADPSDPTRPDPLVHHSWSEYLNGAAPYGAPVRSWRLPDPAHPGDSLDVPGPDVRGDLMLWSVYNDLDPSHHTNEAGGSMPLGLEVQQTTYAFNGAGALRNTVFLEFRIVHPRALAPPPGSALGDTLKNVYVSLWMDPDLGGASDDLVGCDPSRSLGYCYNAAGSDAQYGSLPPALGILLLRGPTPTGAATPLGMTAFNKYISGTDPASALQTYDYMQGLNFDGSPLIDPVTGLPTTYAGAGDPVAGTGWSTPTRPTSA